ncbi:MAG: HAMP domain-containing histidine kinase [Lachnospiraceae bacterium]|nr:HAMP domain-containing histidine kinase [Lachnospiraceae bacterium]
MIVFGLFGVFHAFRDLEMFALSHGQHDVVRTAAFRLLLCGGSVILGISVLVFLLLCTIRRTSGLRKDVNLLKQKNQNIEKLNAQTRELAHHQRLETIGTLTASIAHEFNNLLTPIMGYSMLALEKLPAEEEELYDNILEIYEASRKAKNIISRLSDLARKNSSEVLRSISIDDLVKKTLDVAAPAKPEDVQIRLDLNCWDQRFMGNEIQINQLLLNLVLNSFHAIGDKEGSLTIHTSFDEASIQIRVEDTGCGIPDDIKAKIFEPFFTTKEAGKGTGLGLAIAAQVVEDHHGKIQVESFPGQGTVMTINLPKAADHSETV